MKMLDIVFKLIFIWIFVISKITLILVRNLYGIVLDVCNVIDTFSCNSCNENKEQTKNRVDCWIQTDLPSNRSTDILIYNLGDSKSILIKPYCCLEKNSKSKPKQHVRNINNETILINETREIQSKNLCDSDCEALSDTSNMSIEHDVSNADIMLYSENTACTKPKLISCGSDELESKLKTKSDNRNLLTTPIQRSFANRSIEQPFDRRFSLPCNFNLTKKIKPLMNSSPIQSASREGIFSCSSYDSLPVSEHLREAHEKPICKYPNFQSVDNFVEAFQKIKNTLSVSVQSKLQRCYPNENGTKDVNTNCEAQDKENIFKIKDTNSFNSENQCNNKNTISSPNTQSLPKNSIYKNKEIMFDREEIYMDNMIQKELHKITRKNSSKTDLSMTEKSSGYLRQIQNISFEREINNKKENLSKSLLEDFDFKNLKPKRLIIRNSLPNQLYNKENSDLGTRYLSYLKFNEEQENKLKDPVETFESHLSSSIIDEANENESENVSQNFSENKTGLDTKSDLNGIMNEKSRDDKAIFENNVSELCDLLDETISSNHNFAFETCLNRSHDSIFSEIKTI